MKRLLVVLFTLCAISTNAQFRPRIDYSLTWCTGSVVFYTGDTLACTLRYNHPFAMGVLQIMQDEEMITVTANDVKEFRFYDPEKQKWRKVTSITLAEEAQENQKYFMELVYNDKHLAILNHRTMDVPFDYMNYTRFISKPVRMTKRYLWDSKTGALLPLSKENALKLLEPKRQEITSYINERHLRFRKVTDYIDVFEYHASL